MLISDDGEIIAGHGRVEAAKLLGLESIPTVRLSHLDAAQRRAYVLADNKLEPAGTALLAELQELIDLDFEVEITGFSSEEVDLVLDEVREASPQDEATAPEDDIPAINDARPSVTRRGDLWLLGRHRLLCGDAQHGPDFQQLLDGERADLIFTDAPDAASRDRDQREHLMGMLVRTLGHTATHCRDGALAFIGTRWQHIGDLLAAGRAVFTELVDLCVWLKADAEGQSFYRPRHELVLLLTVGDARPTNTFQSGTTGRVRSNVWDYPSAYRLRERCDMDGHASSKPVALVADAIKNATRRGDLVLDPFGAAGTTLIAAKGSGRRARLIELDPRCCDQIVRRFEQSTGKPATLASTDETFEAVAEDRGIALHTPEKRS